MIAHPWRRGFAGASTRVSSRLVVLLQCRERFGSYPRLLSDAHAPSAPKVTVAGGTAGILDIHADGDGSRYDGLSAGNSPRDQLLLKQGFVGAFGWRARPGFARSDGAVWLTSRNKGSQRGNAADVHSSPCAGAGSPS